MKVEVSDGGKRHKQVVLAVVVGTLALFGLIALVVAAWANVANDPAARNTAVLVERQDDKPAASAPEVIVYASDLDESALYELDFSKDPASPGGKMIGLANTGDELDPPPENDPNVRFKVKVQSGIPYRCWVHMKVGAPKGKSQANKFWVQFTGATDQAGKGILKPGTDSYLTAQGPEREGWAWVEFKFEGSNSSESLVFFRAGGEATVRMQAGMEGVGFDQFVLSPAKFLEKPPAEAIVKK